jgi:isopenicillin-N epimerase
MGGRPSDIALTGSTTMGLALLYHGIAVRPNQEILTTVHDHNATSTSIQLRADRMGTPVRRIRLYEAGVPASVDEIAGRLRAQLRPETRVVAVTWVHSNTGMRLPIAEMAAVLREANRGRTEGDRILLCVDGVHGFGVEDIDIRAMGCDFFSAGCHKWLFGPRGTGVLWGNPETQRFVTPTIPSFSGTQTWGRAMSPGGFHSFEHRWALAPAFEFHQQIGKGRVAGRIHEFARQCKEALVKMPKVKLYTPMEDTLSAGLVCFDVEGMGQSEVVSRLRQSRIIASTTPYNPSYARLTPGLLNTPEEVEQTLAAIRELAG